MILSKIKIFKKLYNYKQKGYALLGLAVLGFVLVGLVALLLQKSIYTQELEIARMKRRVLFLELDSLFQGVKKQAATLNESQLDVQDDNFLYLEVGGQARWRVKRSKLTTEMQIDFHYIPKDLKFRRVLDVAFFTP